MGNEGKIAQMPNEIGDYDESDTTADEFHAMWESATPVETVTSVADRIGLC